MNPISAAVCEIDFVDDTQTPQIITAAQALAEDASPWPPPRPLSRPAAPGLDYSKAIPSRLAPLRDFCAAVGEALQVHPDLVAPLGIALASLGTSRALEVELSPQWRETGPLWVCALAEPGERKSALLGLLAKPLHAWQAEQRDYLRHALAEYEERRRSTEARLSGTRAKLAKAKPGELRALESQALELAASLEGMPPLAAPELVTSNATPEAVRDLLTRNGEKVGIVSAETDAGQLLGGRYAKNGAANIDLFLAAFTGDPCPSHRIGRDMPLARPALAMALCVQPQALADVLRDPVARGRGFVDRLCLIHPPSRMGSRSLHPASVPPALVEWWGANIRRLLDLRWPGRVTLDATGPVRCEVGPRVLRLTPEASDAFDALRLDLESRIGETGDLRPVSGFASKLPGVVARIALVMQAMQDPSAERITGETMRAACEWAPFLLGHFRSILGDAGDGDAVRIARRLLAAIKRHRVTELSAKEAFDLLDGGALQTMEELHPALDLLLDKNWLRELPPPQPRPGRPPSPRFTVNPAALYPSETTGPNGAKFDQAGV
ncbi:MAG: YfjI family protein [Opitutaceae bacterium]|jgi:hypothetical protein|nr:YfjI family protein [Opitutaceae bacterium]